MIKKTIIFASLILAVVLISGCAKKGAENKNQNTDKNVAVPQENTGGIINSIKDAMGLGKKMKCTYNYPETNDIVATTTTYIQGQKFRGESMIGGKNQLMVFDGDTMYMWSDSDKKGTKWSKSCMDELNKDSNTADNNNGDSKIPEDKIDDPNNVFNDASNVECSEVDSIDFSVPSDINFSDMCQELKTMQEKMKSSMPQGVVPEGVAPVAPPKL